MSIKALSEYTFYSRYARYNKDKKRRETWKEAVGGLFDMHRTKYKDAIENNPLLGDYINFAQKMQNEKKVLASQRSLQFKGDPIFRHSLKMYNCLTSHIDRVRVFQECMYALLCGCGVGFSVQTHHIKKLPVLQKLEEGSEKTYVVQDSIEGWADAIGVLVNSYFRFDEEFQDFWGKKVVFDFSLIRPEGSLIAGQFKAPGPVGLSKALEKIRDILTSITLREDSSMKSIEAYDIIMHISDSILSGGIRRSATICLFSMSDKEMMTAKTGNWFNENPQRGRSNNSVALPKGKVTKEQFSEIMKSTKEFGEPGFIWLDDLEIVYNPCCVAGDTIINTNCGDYSIKDIVEAFNNEEDSIYRERLFGSGEESLKILSYDSDKNILVFSKLLNAVKTRENSKTLKIVISGGYSFECTHDHKVCVVDFDKFGPDSVKWVESKDLKVDDYVMVRNGEVCQILDVLEGETQDVYDIEVEGTHNFFANDILVHNCEIGMIPKTVDGRSGWQSCNLTEINGKFCTTKELFFEACKASAIIGTLQAGYTDLKYFLPESKEIFEYEALLGCSVTGWMDNPEILFNPEIQKEGARIIKETNEEVAAMIGIKPAARMTCAKPSGSTSCILGTASGIHPHHAKRYIRRVQANKNEFCLQKYIKENPLAVEESVWSSNKTDMVISFLCEVPPGAIVKNQLSAIELLDKVRLTQQNWVEAGTVSDRAINPKIRNNISNTILVAEHEWQDVEDYIFDNQEWFAGISLLPASGDLDYPQAPFATVLTPSEIVKEYGDASVFASGLIVDGLKAFDDNLWRACATVLGIGDDLSTEDLSTLEKIDWVRRATQFADRYFGGDVKRMTYCLKHVSLWKTWCDLKREYKDIDWSKVVEEDETFIEADTMGAAACAGGKCLLEL